MKTAILIPSLNPDERLPKLVDGLFALGMRDIILVDDGSKVECKHYFAELQTRGCILQTHAINLGKGRALKTGMNAFLNHFPGYAGVVTADADGQHSPEDILKLCQALEAHPDQLILGARDFSQEDVPFKSRYGNRITRFLFGALSGLKLQDTQTGLRAIPRVAMPWMMELKGERFEYEMNMLVECKPHELGVFEVPIQTIYMDENASSHFHPFRDAMRIYAILGRFALASFGASLVDLLMFALLTKAVLGDSLFGIAMTEADRIAVATVGARIVSSLVNYTLNRNMVFRSKAGHRRTLLRYYILVAVQMTCSALLVATLTPLVGIDEVIVKLVVDVILFFCSFQIQQKWVFSKKKTSMQARE